MPITPGARDIVHAEIEHYLSGLHTCMPAEVLKVYSDAGRQFVDVLPSLQHRSFDEDGAEIEEQLPPISKVPLAFAHGGTFFISLPVAVGDIVTLIFAERSLDTWIEQAKQGSGRSVNPGDGGTHTLNGAIALPMRPASKGELLQGVHAANMVIGVDGASGAGQIHITPAGFVLIGGPTATQAMILGTAHIAQLTTIMSALGTLLGGLIPASGVTAGQLSTFATALSVFMTHLSTTALSTKHKLDG